MNPVSEGVTLVDVWGPTPDNLFATGAGGTILRYDGKWRKTQAPTTENLTGIWGTSASHIIAVGARGTILKWNGSAWSDESTLESLFFQDVWGSSPNDVFAVGTEPGVTGRVVVHYNGASWTRMTVPAGFEPLTSVWGSGPTNVYCTGLGKSLFHYDGVDWEPVLTASTFALTAVYGFSATDVFAVGGNGAAVHWDGVQWTPIDIGVSVFMQSVWGTSGTDLYAVGLAGAAYHYNGATWSPIELRSFKALSRVFGVEEHVVAVGEGGTIHRTTGGGWDPGEGCMTRRLNDVWVSPDGTRAFAVGDMGTFLHFENGVWNEINGLTTQDMRGLSGTAADDVMAVGAAGTVFHWNGGTWFDISTGVPLGLNDVWMDGTYTAYAVGEQLSVFRWDGGSWNQTSLGVTVEPLFGVWGSSFEDIWVTGYTDAAFRWNGLQWKLVTIDAFNTHQFHDVHGTGPNDVYVATEYIGPRGTLVADAGDGAYRAPLHAGGYIFRWNGLQWQPVYQDGIHDVLAIWRSGVERGFATGDAGSILLDTETGAASFQRLFDFPNLPFLVTGVWGSSNSNVFVVGDNGTILRYSP